MENEKKKFSIKRLLITILLILLTAGATGGSVWYMMDIKFIEAQLEYNRKETEFKKLLERSVVLRLDEIPSYKKDEVCQNAFRLQNTGLDTEGWKQITESNFTFMYPSHLYSEKDDALGWRIQNTNIFSHQDFSQYQNFEITYEASEYNLDDYLNKMIHGDHQKTCKEKATVNGIAGYVYEINDRYPEYPTGELNKNIGKYFTYDYGHDMYGFAFEDNGRWHYLEIEMNSIVNVENYRDMMNEIISTLKQF